MYGFLVERRKPSATRDSIFLANTESLLVDDGNELINNTVKNRYARESVLYREFYCDLEEKLTM